jgi:hypothetical protein
MGLTMKEKQAVTREMALEYKRATKKRKGEILDSLVGLTECNRAYAARALRQRSREVVLGTGRVGERRGQIFTSRVRGRRQLDPIGGPAHSDPLNAIDRFRALSAASR